VWNSAALGCAASVFAIALGGCGSSNSSTTSSANTSATTAKAATTPAKTTKNSPIVPTYGEISLSSPAFANNARLPAQYTCDGADVSPPLQWQDIPAGAAELFLIALELRSGLSSAQGAVTLWSVAGLAPSDGQIEAGSLPPGAVVGANAAGKAAWGGVCGKKGQHHHIAFLLTALSKKLHLKTGFDPTAARARFKGTGLARGLMIASYKSS
jgi:phosphatidylethanolamine-binding protein (PEBP) family uncharacterized protein